MIKSYVDYMNELTQDELYEGLLAHGLFCEKLPPVFTMEPFFKYCNTLQHSFSSTPRKYVIFDSMRNINVPRQFGLPTPMAYQKLCKCLSDNWPNLQAHFQNTTSNQQYKVSGIHIRKFNDKKSLFEMNSNNQRTDDSTKSDLLMVYSNQQTNYSPEPDLLIGKRWLVKADIAIFFPSVYSHSIPWALVGKKCAKANQKSGWYNEIDRHVRQLKDNETHGLLIGPHTSNLLSEIILARIDKTLVDEGWQYIRNIDDYSCYVETYEDGQKFLIRLNALLREYDLLLNHKKTEIMELPIAAVEQWKRQINLMNSLIISDKMDYKAVRAYLDSAIELLQSNKNNAAILNYTIKVLKHQSLTESAKEYCTKTIMHLSIIYPYLIPILDENVFKIFEVTVNQIKDYTEILYRENLSQQNYEGVYYAIYFAIKYEFELVELTAQKAIETNDCILLLFTFCYFKKKKDSLSVNALEDLKNYAQSIDKLDFGKYWIFLYEILSVDELLDEWKAMKNKKITFLSI